MMRNVLYIMNVDWNWIKQRPHFIAEGLSEKYNVKIVYQHHYNRKSFQKRDYANYNVSAMYVIPRIDRYQKLSSINSTIRKQYYKKNIKESKPDLIYLTYPTQIESIPRDYKGKILYDCMDNYPMFDANKDIRDKLINSERKLCERSDVILCSSIMLKKEISNRYGSHIGNKAHIVRNGFNGDILQLDNDHDQKNHRKGDMIELCYFGTVSEWFDFDLILKSLNDFDNIKYILYGPTERSIPIHERIDYRGTIEHAALYKACQGIDCFIMPFILNDVIKAVDPVKLYEYVNFRKKVISVRYDEIMRFATFVDMYNGYDEYRKHIENLTIDSVPHYDDSERVSFLSNNNWTCRIDDICELVEMCF